MTSGISKVALAPTKSGAYLAVMDQEQMRQLQGLNRPGLDDPKVLAALSRVPRERFVPASLRTEAYQDRALPIGKGQTISQPYMVGCMTQLSAIENGSRVLEIGTGSGYQAAVLAELGAEVYSVEIVPSHARRAKRLLRELGYEKVHVIQGDGWRGLSDVSPFDVILITAACPRVPEHLLNQLRDGGRMILPLEEGKPGEEVLIVVTKEGDGFSLERKGGVRFVPLTGEGRTS